MCLNLGTVYIQKLIEDPRVPVYTLSGHTYVNLFLVMFTIIAN